MTKYALSGDDLRRELKAIDDIHRILSPLATASRHRVHNWLYAWIREEAPPENRDELMPF